MHMMEVFIKLAFILLYLTQLTSAQPNLAAIWGLGALGDLGEGGLGALGGMGGFNGLSGDSNSGSSSGSGSCPYQAHPNKFKFTQIVNNRRMTQECAPGTMFVLSKCSCDNIPSGGIGVPMPGSNPRLEAQLGGGGNALLNALVSQLGGGGSNPQPPAPPIRNKPPPMSNHINRGVRPRVSSGIRPNQSSGNGGMNFNQGAPNVPYNTGSSSGLSSVVDPTILPNVLPAEIMQMLQASSGLKKAPVAPGPTQSTARRTMERKPTPAPTKSTRVDVSALARAGMPPEVLNMLQRSMGPPSSAGSQPKPNMGNGNIARSNPVNPRMVPSPTRATRPRGPSMPMAKPTMMSNTKPQTGQRQDPFAALLGLSQPRSSQSSNRLTNNTPKTNDPLAAMMASLGGSGNSRSSSSSGSGSDAMMAAMMASMGGGSNSRSSSSSGSGSDPMMAAMMASMAGGSSGSSNQLAALLSGSSRSGSPSARGGPLDVTSLAGNVNVAALLGETPGPGLAANVDMTALFNAQGQMGAGGGLAALSGLNNLNILKLQQLDRQGVIDISDLTPAGLAAANAHFG